MKEIIKDKVIEYFEGTKDLRVLFFFDEDGEYTEIIDHLSIPNIKIVKWENNPFTLKVRLNYDLKNEKIVLYLTIKRPSTQDEYHIFPLLGLLLANKELQLDDSGSFIEEFGLGRHQKALIERYISELKYTRVKEVCKPILNPQKLTEELLQQGLISAILKFSTIQNWPILIIKLATLILNEQDYNRVIRKLKSLKIESAILSQIKRLIDAPISNLSLESLKIIAQTLRYNQITQTITEVDQKDPYLSLKTSDQEKIIQLNRLLFEIEADRHMSRLIDELFIYVDNEIKGELIIQTYGTDQEYACYSSSMVWEVIKDSLNYIFDVQGNAYKQLEKLSLQNGLSQEAVSVIEFLLQTVKLIKQINSVDSYILNSPEDYLQWYVEEVYLVDQYYRRSISSRKKIDETELPSIIKLDKIIITLNEKYEAHTDKLNREWLKCLHEKNFDYSAINHPKQYDFYKTVVESVNNKVVVIISDALRYEAGMELVSQMHSDPKNVAEVKSMLASLPSKTNIGMAQLLPGNSLDFNGGDIIIDNISCSGTSNRQLIITNHKANCRAIQFEALDGTTQDERRELFKHELVYVYHDVIDATGDKKNSERRTFDAVSDAIEELRKFIKSLHATYNVAKVYVTADHGFLYSDSLIQDKNLEKIDEVDSISSHNRYFLSKKFSTQNLGYTFPISKTTKFIEDLFVTIPKSINRYRKQGVGHQFVHGGGSLQELVVPLIESSRKRVDLSKKVTPQLVSNQSLKIVSNVLRINLLQKQPVSHNEKELKLSIGLYDDLVLASNEEIRVMNFTSDSPSERVIRVELVLKASNTRTSFLKFKVYDVEDKLNPLIEERVKNNTLIQTEF